ncbi:MAG: tyrosine-type recombinase/integrase [Clostridia bacterium]|nr:tyrosine-type recombinase/integrase [Clostridia bacterium]
MDYRTAQKLYLDSLTVEGKSTNTIKGYSRILEDFGTFTDGKEIMPITVSDWRTAKYENGIKGATIAHYMTVLSMFFAWGMEQGIFESNPFIKISKPKKEEKKYDILSRDQIQTLISYKEKAKGAFAKNNLRNRAIVHMLIMTGLRNSELRALTLHDLDFENGIIRVIDGKGGKSRSAPFPKTARETLAEYLASGARPENLTENDLLFGTDADEKGHSTHGAHWNALSSAALLQIVSTYTEKVCGHAVGVHTLRHCAASLWDDMKIPIRDVQKALGHANIATTEKVYIQILNPAAAAQNISAVMDSI